MFIDWLTIYQDHDEKLPVITDQFMEVIDTLTGERVANKQPNHKHEGSHSTSLQITLSGGRVKVSGNPSRIDRMDNLFGYTDLDQCVQVYNCILKSYGLPEFTKCSYVGAIFNEKTLRFEMVPNGAVITEIHVTTNIEVGPGNTEAYLRGLSTQKYRNMTPNLYSNGKTLDWKTTKGNASLIYPSVYDKANELRLRTQEKIKRLYGEASPEHQYIKSLINHCEQKGILRAEQKIKARQLKRIGCQFYGLIDFDKIEQIHNQFLSLDENLQVNNMNIENISERLISQGIVTNTKAANTTTMYAMQWMTGHTFDFTKSQVQIHRARLRRIGIDIGLKFDSSRHSPVFVTKVTEIEVRESIPPAWYLHADTHQEVKYLN